MQANQMAKSSVLLSAFSNRLWKKDTPDSNLAFEELKVDSLIHLKFKTMKDLQF